MAARKNTRSQNQSQRGVLPWGPMLLSFAVGAFVMFLLHIKDNVPADQQNEVSQKQQKKSAIEPTFDFYTLLPESEEVVKTQNTDQQNIVTSPLQEKSEPSADSNPTEKAVQQVSYMIQVGSFKKLTDADGFRAKLAFLGVESKVQTVTIDDKDTWHRVQVGPIVGRDKADALQKQLRENGFDSLLLRAKHS